ncbi:hypothetical protein KJ966_20980 [bacterium]|nr:hypothetical protein [bacterium]
MLCNCKQNSLILFVGKKTTKIGTIYLSCIAHYGGANTIITVLFNNSRFSKGKQDGGTA